MVRIESDVKLDYKDVLIRPKRSTLKSRSEVDLNRSFICRNARSKNDPSKPLVWEGVPIMVANMDATGTFEMAIALAKHKCVTVIIKAYSVQDWVNFANKHPSVIPWVSACAGTSEADFNKVKEIIRLIPDIRMVCLDAANAYTEPFVEAVKQYRQAFPFHALIAGNCVTGEMVEELILSGADIVKVGIGPGSVCTTRTKTGVGYPQLSAVLECADAAHGLGGMICADGGTTSPGDFSKAFGAGADFVMSGGMFAGHAECGGEVIEKNGKKYLEFYGMSSTHAMEKHHGGVAEYRASEGKAVLVPYKGPVEVTILDILGGIRSTCTYVGASKLKELSKRTTFVRVTQQVNTVFEGNIDTTKTRELKTTAATSAIISSNSSEEANGESADGQESKRMKE